MEPPGRTWQSAVLDRTYATLSILARALDDCRDTKPLTEKGGIPWLVWNIDPGRELIPAHWSFEPAHQRTNEGGEGYGVPAPPDTRHSCRFERFAPDTTLGLAAKATVDELGRTMSHHVLTSEWLMDTYAP